MAIRTSFLAVMAALVPASACAGLDGEPTKGPPWFEERAAKANKGGYPDLSAIPEPRIASAESEARWNSLANELDAIGKALDADVRAAPAPAASDVAAFEAQARAEIERGR